MKRLTVGVFCASSLPLEGGIVPEAEALGRWIAREGHTLVYGGSNLGLMGCVSGAALEGGGRVVGVIPTLFSDEVIESQPVTELLRVRSMAERKERIIGMCDLFIALPGGIGTIDEISEVMVYNQLNMIVGKVPGGSGRQKPMLLLNIFGYYDAFIAQVRRSREAGLLRADCGLHSYDTLDAMLSNIGIVVAQ